MFRFLTAGAVLCALLNGTGPLTAQAEERSRPNVILFIGDDISWNDYGCYGNSAARTPRIDELAAAGLRFTNAYLTASSCSPSRSSIVTGRYPHNNGKAAELHLPIADHLPWFPALLRESGYYTALVGKNHMSTAPDGTAPGPDVPRFSPSRAFDLIDGGNIPGNRGGHGKWVETLRQCPEDRPFFLWLASYDAHRGWDADRDWDAQRSGPPHRAEDVVVPPFLSDDPETRADLASYYNEVTRFDYYIGQVVDELGRREALDNTLILVLADNGRPFPRAKTRLHDSGMKTALVAHWPRGIAASRNTCDSLVSVIDLAPTILRAAGVDVPETMQGVSLLPLFENPDKQVRKYAFSEHNWHDYEAHGRSVRDARGRLFIRNFRPSLAWQGPADSVRSPSHRQLRLLREQGKLNASQADVFRTPRPTAALYDTPSDPRQLRNAIEDPEHAGTVRQLGEVLDRWMRQTHDSVPERLSADSFDRDTGDRLPDAQGYRGTTPGEDREATQTNHPGPR